MSVAVSEALREHRVVLVGIGADGWPGLSDPARHALRLAGVVVGSTRQLELLPEEVTGERLPWPSPLRPAVGPLLRDHRDQGIVVLASGDPMHFGVGRAVMEEVGAEAVHVVPHPSSISLACARLGWSVEDVVVRSMVGRDPAGIVSALFPQARLVVLCADAEAVPTVAALLSASGYGPSQLVVLTDLGTSRETRTEGLAHQWSEPVGGELVIVAVHCLQEVGEPRFGLTPGLPDDAFEHDGQLTKATVRAVTVSSLAPRPGELLWDVGGGAGSIAIEWARAHPTCRAVCVEAHPDRAERIRRNAQSLGVPSVQVVEGRAPAALGELPDPDVVFIGGGLTVHGVAATCWNRLRPGGRLVANAVTIESEALLARAMHRLGGALTRVSIERAEPVGRFLGWSPARPVVQWVIDKPLTGAVQFPDFGTVGGDDLAS